MPRPRRVPGVRCTPERDAREHRSGFANWDQDETALAERYWEQSADTVRAELAEEGERFAADLDTVRADELSRPGRRSNGSTFTVDTLARYFLHDLVHHVHDVTPAQD